MEESEYIDVVRRPTLDDVPEMLKMSRVFYDEMDFDKFGWHFDEDVIGRNYIEAILNPEKFIVYIYVKEAIQGIMFSSVVDTSLYFTGRKFAQEVVWHSDPKLSSFVRSKVMIRLLMATENELTRVGVKTLYVSTDLRDGYSGVSSYLEKKGYTKMCEYWCRT